MNRTRLAARTLRSPLFLAFVLPLFAALLAAPGGVLHAAPDNDDIADATPITSASGSLSATSVDATDEAGEPDVIGSNSVWWRWTPPSSGTAVVDTIDSGYDTTLAAFDSDLELRDSNDDTHGLQSEVSFSVTAGNDYLVRVAGYGGATGPISLSWSVTTSSTSNDDFAGRIALEGDSGTTTASSSGATDESWEDELFPGSSDGQRSLWWSWTPPLPGVVRVDTFGSGFDTTLAVVTGAPASGVDVVGSNDDAEGLQSAVTWTAAAGVEYSIRVAGYGGDTGAATLNWQSVAPCEPPDPPAAPSPEDGATDVGTSARLDWSQLQSIVDEVIYGDDDRRDVYELTDPQVIRAWRAPCALVGPGNISDRGATYRLSGATLGAEYDLCSDQLFRDQPTPAFCTGFLVAPDIVATAGHCVSTSCDSTAFVFGFEMANASTPIMDIPAEDVYFCAGVVGHEVSGGADWALIRLDRPVANRTPVEVRRDGRVPNSAPLIMMGHPSGLPGKIAAGANVRDNSPSSYFIANLDAFGGNSGSPVFHSSTLAVEGILVRGETDYTQRGGCTVVNECSDSGCRGEDATRTTEFADLLVPTGPSLEFEVWIGRCGEDLQLLAETAESFLDVDDLDADAEYGPATASHDRRTTTDPTPSPSAARAGRRASTARTRPTKPTSPTASARTPSGGAGPRRSPAPRRSTRAVAVSTRRSARTIPA